MSFPTLDASKRSDESFRNREQQTHHKEYSLLEELPIKMVEDFPIADPLHLLEHGVMKKLMKMWMKGSTLYDSKFTKLDIRELDRKFSKRIKICRVTFIVQLGLSLA